MNDPSGPRAKVRVSVQAGPDAGRSVPLGAEPMTIGRGQGEGLQLSDTAISRHHLTVEVVDAPSPGVRVVEISGVNPAWTLRNGKREVLKAGDTVAAGASVTVGNSTLTFSAEATGAAGPSVRTPTQAARATIEMDARRTFTGSSRLAALSALGDRLARCSSLQAVYRSASTWAIEALPATRALLLSPDGTDILAAASSGPVGDLAISSSILSRVLAEERAFLVNDVLAEPDLADRRSVQVRGIRGALAAPAQNLVFYAEWGAAERVTGRYDDDALTLMVCAAQLVSALGETASERSQLRAAASSAPGVAPTRMVGTSPAMKKMQVFLERVAASTATVLLNGESGTGKELAAKMVHALSPRAARPFVAINCAAVPENLMESEFFGHEKGAFTGAVAQHQGVFERAHTGTLFLDEIAEMSHATQARMLRVLENHSFTRVGGTKDISVDVRLVAATHQDLRKLVETGRFREDLLYRLSVIQTELPPLRARREDISELVRYFTSELGDSMGRHIEEVTPDATAVLERYRWPGNIRELRNVVERALVLGDGPVLELDDLPPELQHAAPIGDGGSPAVTSANVLPLAELESQAIGAALEATGGNKARAAALLGIDRTTLYRKLKDMS